MMCVCVCMCVHNMCAYAHVNIIAPKDCYVASYIFGSVVAVC